MGIPALRQYIDAAMPLAPKGNGIQICSVYNFQIFFADFFFLFSAHRLMKQNYSVRLKAVRVTTEKKNMRLAAAFCQFMGTSPINFGLLGGKEIH
jgi:hypothetical protein